jgi:uncharacterized protein YjiS (DUF1127 family)
MSDITSQIDRPNGTRPTVGDQMLAALETLGAVALQWQRRASARRHLRGLDDDAVRDAGLSRADVAAEGSKPFWRP